MIYFQTLTLFINDNRFSQFEIANHKHLIYKYIEKIAFVSLYQFLFKVGFNKIGN
jgi:hypothetical protein